MDVSVIIPTYNPHPGRLARVLAALRTQALPASLWETILVDNASQPPVEPAGDSPPAFRIVREMQPGLTAARRRGFAEARGSICVLVDDDNVLAPDYLSHVVGLFREHPQLGAIGGKSQPEFERPPAGWQREFFPLLALRDHGGRPHIAQTLRPPGAARNEFPALAGPLGAGMAIRREAARQWAAQASASSLCDRQGGELTSGGDNDIVFVAMKNGWAVAYFPELVLTHLIPAGRLEPDYLARLNRSIQKSWMQVLTRHDANPWPAITRWTLPIRQARAWLACRAWSSPAARVRWQGACGHFEGRIARGNGQGPG